MHPKKRSNFPEEANFAKKPKAMRKIATLNVASLKAALNKGLLKYIETLNVDILCLQETKLQEVPPAKNIKGEPSEVPIPHSVWPHQFWFCSSKKKGYSGTCILSKINPISHTLGIKNEKFDEEGRTITLEFPEYFLVACYAPNAGSKLERLEFKRDWSLAVEKYLLDLYTKKEIIFTGDMNVAHKEIDLANPKTNLKSAGFTIEERTDFSRVLDNLKFTDVFRSLHSTPGYTYFSYRFNARVKNIGWRLDYFLVTSNIFKKVESCEVLNAYTEDGKWVSDHLPLVLEHS